MPRENSRGIVLVSIGIYATVIIVIKFMFAIGHHLKWMLFEKCCLKITKDMYRVQKLTNYWK
jgi:hypothetical protein